MIKCVHVFRSCLPYLLMLLVFAASPCASAIATADDAVSAQDPAGHGYDLNWNYIYHYKGSSSVAVDHYWVLTAAHVANDVHSMTNLIIDGKVYTQQEIVFHDSADLALVRYDKPMPGYYLLHEGELHDGGNGPKRLYYELIMAGFGRTGTVSQTSFSNGPGGNGTKRWGTNQGTGSEGLINTGDEAASFATQCFELSFDLSDTDYEAGGNTYDSGGPVFIDDGVGWLLTGIILYRPTDGNNYAAMIHDYSSWIKSVIVDYDTDMDGLPDWWELEYGMDETSMVATNDLDGDLFTNYEEWVADTIPTDSSSYLRILDYPSPTELVFGSSTNRQYRVQYRTDLTDTNETWAAETEWFGVSGTQTVKTVSTPSSNRFYQIQAKLH